MDEKPCIKHSIAELTSSPMCAHSITELDTPSTFSRSVSNLNLSPSLSMNTYSNITLPKSNTYVSGLMDDVNTKIPKKFDSEKVASYTEMIARAIFSGKNNMCTLQEIYAFLISNFPILHSRGKSWKNSVRHTLSLNEWFMKIPRSDNSKSCYWCIHPVYINRFKNGDFQKHRKASMTRLQHTTPVIKREGYPMYCYYPQSPPPPYCSYYSAPSPYRERYYPYLYSSYTNTPSALNYVHDLSSHPIPKGCDTPVLSHFKGEKIDTKNILAKLPSNTDEVALSHLKWTHEGISNNQKTYINSLISTSSEFSSPFNYPTSSNVYFTDNNYKEAEYRNAFMSSWTPCNRFLNNFTFSH